ncbi:NADH-quinone oxidoreductase subunit N [Conexibacter sp. DBS9H8]|uniref:NADH-quinone oxidoreductase subunit N n=1 Tax=Conexibacter sp. DBS9H8 TaxID=2937801 RepID=UPI002010B7EE|nr:NADH-quinone oxidoreductase subunit N [Conexibacter sp. DBS9H8]
MSPNGGTFTQAQRAEHEMLKELVWLSPIGALTLAAAGAVLLAIVLPHRRQALVAWWVGAMHLAAAGLAAYVWLDRGFRLTMSGTIAVDGLSLVFTALVGVVGAVCVALLRPAVAGTDREGELYAMLAFASLAAVVLGAAADAALLALALAALGLATFVMTGYRRASPTAGEASIKYYIFGTVSGAAMVYGLSWWFGLGGSTSFAVIGRALPHAPAVAVIASTTLVLVGLGYKAALVPFHFWTPDAYDGAPLPVAAYLSVVPKLAGLIALARVMMLALPHNTVGWPTAIAVIAAATMTLGNLAAVAQRNVVRLLAYSSIAQSGYLLMGVAALGHSHLGLAALVYYALAYAATNLAAFAVVQAVQRERGSADLDAFRGLGRSHPWWTAALVLSFLSLLGLPPLSGFFGKLEVFKAAIGAGQAWLAVIAILNTVVSLYPYLRVIAPAILDPPDPASLPARRSAPLSLALVVATTATVGFGLLAEPLVNLADHARMLTGG